LVIAILDGNLNGGEYPWQIVFQQKKELDRMKLEEFEIDPDEVRFEQQ